MPNRSLINIYQGQQPEGRSYQRYWSPPKSFEALPDQKLAVQEALRLVREGTDWEALWVAANLQSWSGTSSVLVEALFRRAYDSLGEGQHWNPLLDQMAVQHRWPAKTFSENKDLPSVSSRKEFLEPVVEWAIQDNTPLEAQLELLGFQWRPLVEQLTQKVPRTHPRMAETIAEGHEPKTLVRLAGNPNIDQPTAEAMTRLVVEAVRGESEHGWKQDDPHLAHIISNLQQHDLSFRYDHMEAVMEEVLKGNQKTSWYVCQAFREDFPATLLKQAHKRGQDLEGEGEQEWAPTYLAFEHPGASSQLRVNILDQADPEKTKKLYRSACQKNVIHQDQTVAEKLSREAGPENLEKFLNETFQRHEHSLPEHRRQALRRLFRLSPQQAARQLMSGLRPGSAGWGREISTGELYELIGWLKKQGLFHYIEEQPGEIAWLQALSGLHDSTLAGRQESFQQLSVLATERTLQLLESEQFPISQIGQKQLQPLLEHPDPDFRQRVFRILSQIPGPPSPSTQTRPQR